MRHKKSPALSIKQSIAAIDFDGTVSPGLILARLLEQGFTIGMFDSSTEKTYRAMDEAFHERKISFEVFDAQIIELFTNNIREKTKSDLDAVAARVFEKYRDWRYTFTAALLETLIPTHECIGITGAMHEVVELLAPYWGFDQSYCTRLEVNEHGRYTGRHIEVPAMDKSAALLAHITVCGGSLANSVAVGDTGSDISMLAAVDHPIAFNPNHTLGAKAEQEGWPIVVERKDEIYVLHRGVYRMFATEDVATAAQYVLSLKR